MRIVINPDEARRFAGLLKSHSDEITALNRAVSSRLLELRASWSDKRYDQFERRYEEASILLKIFAESADRYAQYLQEKARRIDPYLDRTY